MGPMSLSLSQSSCCICAVLYCGLLSVCDPGASTNAMQALHDHADGEDLQAGSQPAKRTQKVALTHLDEEEDGEG